MIILWHYNYSNELCHHGIKGQKWGIKNGPPYPLDSSSHSSTERKSIHSNIKNRDESITTRTTKGAEVTLSKEHTTAFARFLAKHSKKVRETLENSKSFKISSEGKVIGELDLYKESPTSLNVMWVTISKDNEGRGYGTAVMKAVVKYAKENSYQQITLEVPGSSPNAKHIYEKIGFKETGENIGTEDDVWGGLTKMKLDL